MSRPSRPKQNGPVRRLTAEFVGDAAVELDLLEVQLGIPSRAKSKTERQNMLGHLAIRALRSVVRDAQATHETKYPSIEMVDALIKGGIQMDGVEQGADSALT